MPDFGPAPEPEPEFSSSAEFVFEPAARQVCPGCGTELAPGLLTCPACRRLVHSERLKQLADEAGRAAHPTDALVAWRAALELLPPGSRQHQVISERIAALGREVDARPAGPPPSPAAKAGAPGAPGGGAHAHKGRGWGGVAGGAGTLALLAWKFKTLALIALTKGKLLLTGLTKAGTFWSMALSLGVYWTVWGWRFALGLVLSIYVHEMGHVAALLRYGIKASTPQFIPGLGALIRLRQSLDDPRQDARVGLAGPLWGLGAAAFCAVMGLATGTPVLGAVSKVGAWINLLNLLPFATLDGGRAFHAFTRPMRWLAVLAIAAAWQTTPDVETMHLLVILLVVAVYQAVAGRVPAADRADRGSLAAYAALVACLTFLSGLPAPVPGR